MLSIQEVGGQSLANYWERGMEVIYKKVFAKQNSKKSIACSKIFRENLIVQLF